MSHNNDSESFRDHGIELTNEPKSEISVNDFDATVDATGVPPLPGTICTLKHGHNLITMMIYDKRTRQKSFVASKRSTPLELKRETSIKNFPLRSLKANSKRYFELPNSVWNKLSRSSEDH